MSTLLDLVPPLVLLLYFVAFALVFYVGLTRYRSLLQARHERDAALSRLQLEQRASLLFRIRPLLQRVVAIVSRLEVGREQMGEARKRWSSRIMQAGRMDDIAGDEFLALKLCAPIAALVILPLFLVTQPGILLITMVGAYFLPDLWLRDQVRARSAKIARSLPDTLDTISLMLQAGLGFGQAIDVFAETAEDSPLLAEIKLGSKQMRLGRTRAQVLSTMASHADCLPLTHFTTAVIQSERMGTSIGEALLTQAEEMRTRRFQRAEELGQKAPVKMLGPLLLLVLPNVFIVLFAPMLLRAIAS